MITIFWWPYDGDRFTMLVVKHNVGDFFVMSALCRRYVFKELVINVWKLLPTQIISNRHRHWWYQKIVNTTFGLENSFMKLEKYRISVMSGGRTVQLSSQKVKNRLSQSCNLKRLLRKDPMTQLLKNEWLHLNCRCGLGLLL